MRWEINPPPNSGDGFTFVPDKSIIAPGPANPLVGNPGAVTFVKSDRWYEGKYLGVIGPRIGIAWSPEAKDGVLGKLFGGSNNRTVIRAGYGIAYDPISSFQVTAVAGRVPGYVISCSSTLTDTAPFHTTTPGCAPAVAAGATQLPRLGDGFPLEVPPPTSRPSQFLNAPLQTLLERAYADDVRPADRAADCPSVEPERAARAAVGDGRAGLLHRAARHAPAAILRHQPDQRRPDPLVIPDYARQRARRLQRRAAQSVRLE